MKSYKQPASSHNFTLSTVSTSFQSNRSLYDKIQSPPNFQKIRMDETRIDLSNKNRIRKEEIPIRYSVQSDKTVTSSSTNSKIQTFSRNTSYFSVSQSQQPSTGSKFIKADYEQKNEKTLDCNLKTCTSIENSPSTYERILEKINKKQRLIKQLKQLSKVSVTQMIKALSTPVKQTSMKNIFLGNQQKSSEQHKRGYHSQPSKNEYQENNQYKPMKFDFYRSTATSNNIKLPESPPISYVREKFKTQITQEYPTTQTYISQRNPENQQPKTNQFTRYKYSPKQTKQSIQSLPFQLNFSKAQFSTQNKDNQNQKTSYTSRYNYEQHNYVAPLTTRNLQSKNTYDIRHISDVKRIKNNVNYFSHKKVQISDFCLLKTLGSGKFGTVHQAVHKPTKSIYAIKKIPKNIIKHNLMVDQLVKQIKIQSICRHQNILQLYGFFDDKEYVYLVLEYMSSGTLFEKLKKTRCLSETQASVQLRHVAKAIIYLHQKGIAHRDIKPQNIVIQSGVGKVCDFGWATLCEGDRRKTYCGTFDYAAPQILEGTEYDMTVDLWCLGVMAYELLVGTAPFYHFSRKETMKRIINVNTESISYPSHLSKSAISFIKGLIKKNPQQRMNGNNLLLHPFLSQ